MHENPLKMAEMLTYSAGRMEVPVIVDGDKVTVGFAGDASLRGGIPLFGGTWKLRQGSPVRDHERYDGGRHV